MNGWVCDNKNIFLINREPVNTTLTITPRARWLGALEHQSLDRLPFWPKLGATYGSSQAKAFSGLTPRELQAWIGSDPHEWVSHGVRTIRSRTTAKTTKRNNERLVEFSTPQGGLRKIECFDQVTQSWHPLEMPVKTAADIPRMLAWYEDVRLEPDAAALDQARVYVQDVGPAAVTATSIGTSPLMEWIEFLAGVETAHFLLADYPAEVEALFAVMQRVLLRQVELVCAHNPADLVYLAENTSTTLISPEQYRRYCLPHIRACAEIANVQERRLVLHMCGHLKALLPDLATLPVAAFEAFTSPPVGNTTFADGRAACPRTALIGGTNAVLWTRSAAEIIAELERHLAVLPHHCGLVITSAGVMPPLASPETIREVARWIQRYPARWEG